MEDSHLASVLANMFLKQSLPASENDLLNKRLKLDYEEITPCLKEVTCVWEKMLSTPGRSKIKFDMEKIHSAVGQGKFLVGRGSAQPCTFLAPGEGSMRLKRGLRVVALCSQSVLLRLSLLDILATSYDSHPQRNRNAEKAEDEENPGVNCL